MNRLDTLTGKTKYFLIWINCAHVLSRHLNNHNTIMEINRFSASITIFHWHTQSTIRPIDHHLKIWASNQNGISELSCKLNSHLKCYDIEITIFNFSMNFHSSTFHKAFRDSIECVCVCIESW